MKNFLASIVVLTVLAAAVFGAFYQFDPDFRFGFDRAFPAASKLADGPASKGNGRAKAPSKPHLRQPQTHWARIDAHALATPHTKTGDVPTLTDYLIAPAKNDWEKVRAIFRWIAQNLRYDDEGYNNNTLGPNNGEKALQTRKGVCGDYALLFQSMCKRAKIEAEVVSGWSKGAEYVQGMKLGEPDHAWNAVFLEGDWRLFDVTWASGFGQMVNGKLKSTSKYDDGWWDTAPTGFIFKHFPEDSQWQLIPEPMSKAEFERIPMAGLELFDMGFDSGKMLEGARKGEIQSLPFMYAHPYEIKAVKAPQSHDLALGEPLQLEFVCANCYEMVAKNLGDLQNFKKKGTRFTLEFTPMLGKVGVYATRNKNERSYQAIIEYEVKKSLPEAKGSETVAKGTDPEPRGWGN